MYVTVCVVDGTRKVLPWTMWLCSEEHTFVKLFEEVRTRLPDDSERLPTACTLAKATDGLQQVAVELSFNVVQCCALNGSYIRFALQPEENRSTSSQAQANAFSVMMTCTRKLKLPPKLLPAEKYEAGKGDQRLHDDVIDFLDMKKLGFSAGLELTTGKQVVKALTDALFYLQPHSKTLQARVPNFIPAYFMGLQQKVYNDPKSHKHAVLPMKREALQKVSGPLFSLLILPVMQTPTWKEFAAAIRALAENAHKYCTYLEEKADTMQQAHHSASAIRSIHDGKSSTVKFITKADVRKPNLIARYKTLEEKLVSMEENEEPVFLNDFAPVNARLRYVYLHEISLPFKVEVYIYHHGNNLGSLWYAWRVPSDAEMYDPNKSQRIIASIQQNISQYHSRDMRRQFFERFGLVLNARPSVMTEMYQFLTGDSSVTAIDEQVRLKLKFILDSQDPDVIYDLRDINPGRPQKYEQFWKEVEALMNEKSLAAVDARRHGTVCHLAFAFSVRDLRDQVLQQNPSLDAPSVEWIRAQFWPKNPFHASASKHTGRLQIKFMVQSRQLHADHPDAHYCAAIFKYLKQFSIMFRDHTTMVSLDDKHNIKVGEPDFPVAAVDRGKEVLVGADAKFAVGDHDFTKAKVTPSVALICDIPESIGESFYRGRVIVTLKDTIFQPSSPARHAAELKKALTALPGDVNPILCLYTDGGPDHRNTYHSVQISLISLFLSLDLDMLVAARTAPHNSYRNPVERVMSLLNIGLQSVGMMRRKMPEEFEKIIHSCNSMQEIRNSASKNVGMEEAFHDCLQPTLCLLTEVISRLKLKEEPIQVQTPCSKEDIDHLWECIHEIDPSVEMTDTRKEQLASREQLQAFLAHCCIRRHYCFCIKKCGVEGCKICKPPRLPRNVFEKLSFFPDPMKKPATDSYQDFSAVWGTSTSEKDRPSLSSSKKAKEAKEKPKKPFRMTAETVCSIVYCGECLKPRCVYSSRKLTNDEKAELRRHKEEYLYSCGGTIIPKSSGIADICCIEFLDECSEVVSPHYFATRLANTPCCYHCGAFGDLHPITEEIKRSYQTVHPVCSHCHSTGTKERTRGPRFAGKKRAATEAAL